MTEQPKIPPKVKLFMEIFEKMGVKIELVDKNGKPIKENNNDRNNENN